MNLLPQLLEGGYHRLFTDTTQSGIDQDLLDHLLHERLSLNTVPELLFIRIIYPLLFAFSPDHDAFVVDIKPRSLPRRSADRYHL